ncbi:MAG: ABC transporter permease [Nitrososphaerota archaeon]|nr:ABC transporter permease [Nitrososphaerota archaeon]
MNAQFFRKFFRSRLAFGGVVLLLTVLAFAIYSFFLNAHAITNLINPSIRAELPSSAHLFGTDAYGRDLFAISALAIRTDLYIGAVAAVLSSIVGISIGAVSAILKGWKDETMMRTIDIFLSIPALVFALAIVAVLGKSLVYIIIALVVVSSPQLARIVRSKVLGELTKPYVDNLLILGIPRVSILFRHVLKNIGFFLASLVALQVAFAVTVLSALEYIGFGSGSLTPELGAIISSAQIYIFSDIWLLVIPSILLVVVVLAFTLLSNGLRQLDPRGAAS